MYKTDKNRVVLFGLRTQFGGGKSTGFALVYDDETSQKKFEPKHRLIRVGSSSAWRLRSSYCILRAVLYPRLKGLLASYGTKGKTVQKRSVIHRLFVPMGSQLSCIRFEEPRRPRLQNLRRRGSRGSMSRPGAPLPFPLHHLSSISIWQSCIYGICHLITHGSYAHANSLKKLSH